VIRFNDTGRQRPIVLTRHQVEELSKTAGRDVGAELAAMAGERFNVSTLGALMRALAARLTQRKHEASGGDCWCGPSVEYKDPSTGAAVWVHKQVQ
jgi:hypothetical protein